MGDHQCGCRSNRSNINHSFSILQIIEMKWENNETEYQLYIELKKVYDSVRREVLFNNFIVVVIPTKLVRLIEMCRTETYSIAK